MKLLLVLALVGSAAATSIRAPAWVRFQWAYGKTYGTPEEAAARKAIFEQRVRDINAHNLRFRQGLETYEQGINQFSDMMPSELPKGAIVPSQESGNDVFRAPANLVMPKTVDWRKKGYVTPVKNQGQCGSCWAFSTTGALEGQHFKKNKKLVSLSEQNLVDCSQKEQNQGCSGGWPDWAYKYIKLNKGIDTEKSYPYTAHDGTCHYSKNGIGATIKGAKDIKHDNETDLAKAIATIGPISVCIDASGAGFMSYKSGVYKANDCGNHRTNIDHCVLAVGYAADTSGQKYYIVKNSWGTTWGMKGYIFMARDMNNHCAIASQAQYPLV